MTVPDVGSVPLVADMSSTILSRPIDVSKFGVIYAGAQKNIGAAGLVVMIVRDDLLARSPEGHTEDPQLRRAGGEGFDAQHAEHVRLVSRRASCSSGSRSRAGSRRWASAIARRRSCCTATSTDRGFYRNPVEMSARSWMNVPFTLPREELDAAFLKESEAAGLLALKGHRAVGGMRASIYNAMPLAGVQALVDFMKDFAKRNG